MKRVYRSDTEKMLGGVCGGLGEYFNIDPTLLRIAFAAATLVHGFGLVVYIVSWIVIPSERKVANSVAVSE